MFNYLKRKKKKKNDIAMRKTEPLDPRVELKTTAGKIPKTVRP